MVKAYQYKGEQEVEIPQVGLVKPGDVIETELVVNHPDFEEITKKEVKKESKKEE